jgi:hypothetical protein
MPVKARRARYRVGDLVGFLFGVQRAVAQVIEDRGPLGVNGRRVYRIRHLSGMDDPTDFELPEESLEPVTLSTDDVREYLGGGGLVNILGRNPGSEPTPPRAWLSYTTLGHLTHTFDPENGVRGGAEVPLFALNGRKIAASEQGRVAAFIRSFGLSTADADEVVRRVGVS